MQTLQQSKYNTFKHKHTLQIVTATIDSTQWEGLKNSPSWLLVTESDTKEGVLSEVPKETLIELAREKGATAYHTKDEIVEMLEIHSTTLKPYFDDNLVG
jgi:hypothetical protein